MSKNSQKLEIHSCGNGQNCSFWTSGINQNWFYVKLEWQENCQISTLCCIKQPPLPTFLRPRKQTLDSESNLKLNLGNRVLCDRFLREIDLFFYAQCVKALKKKLLRWNYFPWNQLSSNFTHCGTRRNFPYR